MTAADRGLEILQKNIGKELPPGAWHLVNQEQVDQFADVTGDHNYIHVDPVRASESLFGAPVAHGFLTLSLISPLMKTMAWPGEDPYENVTLRINYGLDRVRFISPVRVGLRVRALSVILSAELKDPETIRLKQRITVEVEGQEKPACVAIWLMLLVYS